MSDKVNCECPENRKEAWGTGIIEGKLICNFCEKEAQREIILESSPNEEFEPYEYKHSLNKTIREGKIPFSTTFDIPGKKISEHLALITGVGNAIFTITGTSKRMTNRAATKALNNLITEANRIDANAIVGVNFTIDTHGTGFVNQLVLITGTAVKLEK